MPPHDHLYSSVPNDGVSRLNRQRTSLIHWIVGRFHTLLAEGRDDDACLLYTSDAADD